MIDRSLLDLLSNLLELVWRENLLLKQGDYDAVFDLTDKKILLSNSYQAHQEAIKEGRMVLTPAELEFLREKNADLTAIAEENAEYLEILVASHQSVMSAVADRVNQKNRPSTQYAPNARTVNVNKYTGLSMALDERF